MAVARLPLVKTTAAEEAAQPLVVASPRMVSILAPAERAAACDASVLITGESGVGKDLIARYIHRHSSRRRRGILRVNCAALTESRFESELFGQTRDSLTNRYHNQPGKVPVASYGTLMLDEIGEISLRTQALLLRFLEGGDVQPVGVGRTATPVEVRVVATTSQNVSEMVRSGKLRQEFLYRIGVIQIEIPPLQERLEDIRTLVAHFSTRAGCPGAFSEGALEVLERYQWPGNVRELQQVVEQAIWLASGQTIDVEHLPEKVRVAQPGSTLTRERRKQVADELYEALVVRGCSFWEHIYPLLLSRDITRHDMRELVRRGLASTRGSYRMLLRLFRISGNDYKRFMNCLATHECRVDFREFREGAPDDPPPVYPVRSRLLSALAPDDNGPRAERH
jgi:DNA-binding NtrC family response regulator